MGRRWVFAFERPLKEAEEDLVITEGNRFFSGWNSHGAINISQWRLVKGQFLVVHVPEQDGGPSGCSIDTLSQFVREIAKSINNPLLDEHHVIYQKENAEFTGVSRAGFKELVEAGKLDSMVNVADLSAFHVSDDDIDEGDDRLFSSFLVRAGDSWHRKYWS